MVRTGGANPEGSLGLPGGFRNGRDRRFLNRDASTESVLQTEALGPGLHHVSVGNRMPQGNQNNDTAIDASQNSLGATSFSEVTPDPTERTSNALYAGDENEERGNWSGRFDFVLSLLGYAVGLGNIWRFPYLCYRNGGGAFLMPFLLMMVMVGIPLFYMEASLGQFCSAGPLACWEFAPLFKGVGLGMVISSGLTTIYYNMILGWSLYYLFASFTSNLPWTTCDADWNTPSCSLKLPLVECQTGGQKYSNGTCYDVKSNQFLGLWNSSLFKDVTGISRVSPSEEYWNGRVLRLTSGIHDFGQPKWDLTLCLMLAWIICFFCLLKGIKTTGKVVYFTALFPYVVLVILFFRGVTLDNASEGVRYFIVPQWDRLADARVWSDAANQIFFSLSIAGGGLVTLSSYNRFHNKILRDSLVVALGDSFTCIFGGFVIFSFLGYMAGQLDVPISEVATEGAGLAFVVYPEAVSSLPPPTLWAILFFIMLLTLGLDSQFAMVETVLTGVLDQYPHLRPKKTVVILIICCILFIFGLPLTCPGGMYLLQLMDNYVGGMSLVILGFFEIVAIVFVYGCNRFCKDIHIMTGSTNFIYWKVTWYALAPVSISFIFIYMLVDYKSSKYGNYLYPGWADAIGWLFTLSCVIPIPIIMLYKINREKETPYLLQKLRLLTTPTVKWGPALPKYRALVNYVTDFEVDPYPKKQKEPPKSFDNKAFVNDSATCSRSASRLLSPSQQSLGVTSHSMISGLSTTSVRTVNSITTYETSM